MGNTEEFDGSSWSEVTNTPVGKEFGGFFGTQTASAVVAGSDATANSVTTHEYDGTNWTTGGSIATAVTGISAAGIQTSAVSFGGGSTLTTASQSYDGSAWALTPSLSTARMKGMGAGTRNLALFAGGIAPPTPANDATTATEEFTQLQNIKVITD